MYYNNLIMNKIGTDEHLAARLDQAFAGVKDEFMKSLNNMNDGAKRILYYTSCLTDNYQDVCSKLKEEDKRFFLGLYHLVKDTDVVFHMIYIYIKTLLKNRNAQQKKTILERVVPITTNYSVGQASDAALMYAVTKAICLTYEMNVAVESSLGKAIAGRAAFVTFVLGSEGTIKQSADSANNLKKMCPQFYNALYEETLEMLYFSIEPIITKNGYFNINTASDAKIASTIRSMFKS